MKYTNWTLRLLTLVLATFLPVAQSQAQSKYAPGAPSLNAYNAGPAASENDDESAERDDYPARPGK